MKKITLIIIPAILLLSGCATYKMQKGKSPYEQGYVFSRYNKIIPEYTLGKNNSVPDEQIAQERFKRRREKVEFYYKKMGIIENRFKGMFVDPPIFVFKTLVGIFRMPIIAINDYRYNRDPKYKEKMDQKDEVEYRADKERLNTLKADLSLYIQEDLKSEPATEVVPVTPPVALETPAVEEKAVEAVVQEPPKEEAITSAAVEKSAEVIPLSAAPEVEAKPVQVETVDAQQLRQDKQEAAMAEVKEEPAVVIPQVKEKKKPIKIKLQRTHSAPVAVIVANPTKGPSPLSVQFSAAKSDVSGGRIVSYLWDFGDGDTSTKKSPKNTYWSATFGSRQFVATLTVTDDLGQSATSSINIEVTS